MDETRGDGGDGGPRGQADRNRNGAGYGGTVAQLAVGLPAPGEHLAGRSQRQAVLIAAGDGGDSGPGGHADCNRDAAGNGGAVAERARVVVAPGPGPTGGCGRSGSLCLNR